MRVLITGSRQWLDHQKLYARLDQAFREWIEDGAGMRGEEFTIVHGAAAGADAMAGEWVFDRRHLPIAPRVEVHPAEWSRYGREMAGKIRNIDMIRTGPDLVLAFFQAGAGNVGTRHCVTEAHRWLDFRGVPIEEIWSSV